jgi:hypothetical protein
MPRVSDDGPTWTSVPIDEFSQAVVERLIKIRQPGWRPDQVAQAVTAVDVTVTHELDARPEGAFGTFESIADHLDFLRTSGHPEVGRAVAAAARRAGLREGPARLCARTAASLPSLRYDTQLWACALILRIVDACVRAELRSRPVDAPRTSDGVTVPQIIARLPTTHPQILHPT